MVKVINVTKKYGNFTAVDNVSFEINDGEIVGLLGPNGAGKSTTMNMITGFIEPTDGTITIDGFDIIKKSKNAKREIGYMPEGVPLYFDLTVKEFVNYMADLKLVPSRDRKQEVERVLKETLVYDVSDKLIRNLSRGYKQRVSMAGALVGNPKVLVLDEPTVGLDPKQITEIRSLIRSLSKDHTVILSSHILSEVSQLCDRVIIINRGKVVAVDTPHNLECKVKKENAIILTVEDKNDKISKVLKCLKGVKAFELIKENADGTKQYSIISEDNVDLRKDIFAQCAKEDLVIFEMRNSEVTLEDAFMKLIQVKEEKE